MAESREVVVCGNDNGSLECEQLVSVKRKRPDEVAFLTPEVSGVVTKEQRISPAAQLLRLVPSSATGRPSTKKKITTGMRLSANKRALIVDRDDASENCNLNGPEVVKSAVEVLVLGSSPVVQKLQESNMVWEAQSKESEHWTLVKSRVVGAVSLAGHEWKLAFECCHPLLQTCAMEQTRLSSQHVQRVHRVVSVWLDSHCSETKGLQILRRSLLQLKNSFLLAAMELQQRQTLELKGARMKGIIASGELNKAPSVECRLEDRILSGAEIFHRKVFEALALIN